MLDDACWVGDTKVLGTDHSAATVPWRNAGSVQDRVRGYCGTWRRATFAKGEMLDAGMMTYTSYARLLIGRRDGPQSLVLVMLGAKLAPGRDIKWRQARVGIVLFT